MRDPLQRLSDYFDESLPPEEIAALAAWIAADASHGREFVRASFLHSRLRDVLRQEDVCGLVFDEADGDHPWVDSDELIRLLDEEAARTERNQAAQAEESAAQRQRLMADTAEGRPEKPPAVAGRARPVLYLAVAAALLLAVLSQLRAPRNKIVEHAPAPSPSPPALVLRSEPAVAAPPAIASITKLLDAEWSEGGASSLGDRLAAGRFALATGAAEIRLDSGARIVLEAPAAVELMTADRARLDSGRIVARVPRKAIGFTLQARGATFVDLGTEFGVAVDDAGAADIHVLQGEVALVRGGNADASLSTTLATGAAARVSSDGGEVQPIAYQGDGFLRRVPQTAYELAVWKSKPLAWWRMNEPAESAEVASSGAIPATGVAGTGVTRDPKGSSGSPGPTATFSAGHQGILVQEAAAFDLTRSFSLEAWAFNAGGPATSHRILSNFERPPRRGFAFGVVDGAWFDRETPKRALVVTLHGVYDCISLSETPVNEWMHLAATIDDQGRPRLYLNGEPTETMLRRVGRSEWISTDEDANAWEGIPSSGPLTLGRNPIRPPEEWRGSISHVAVYDRVLTIDEIRRHVKAAVQK